MMSLLEIITILVAFHLNHHRMFKDFYQECLSMYYTSEFPKLVSYNRFVKLTKRAVVPLIIMHVVLFGSKAGK